MNASMKIVLSPKEFIVLEAAMQLYGFNEKMPFSNSDMMNATGFTGSGNITTYVKRLALKGVFEIEVDHYIKSIKVIVPMASVSVFRGTQDAAQDTIKKKKRAKIDAEVKVLRDQVEALQNQLSSLLFQSPVAYVYRKWGEQEWRGVDMTPPSALDAKEWEFRPVFLLNHKPQEIYQHVKSGGVYEMLGPIVFEHNLERAIAYRKLNRGEKPEPIKDLLDPIWGRVESEFMDGRFVKVNPDTLKEVK